MPNFIEDYWKKQGGDVGQRVGDSTIRFNGYSHRTRVFTVQNVLITKQIVS